MRLENVQSVNKCYKELIVVPFFENKLDDLSFIDDIDSNLSPDIRAVIHTGDFKGKAGSNVTLYNPTGEFKRVMLVGGGKKRDFTIDKLRKMIAGIDSSAQSLNIKAYTVLAQPLPAFAEGSYVAGRACAESIILSRFELDQYKTKKEDGKKVVNAVFYGAPKGEFQKGLKDGKIIAGNINMVRGIINLPSNVLTPDELAKKAMEIASQQPKIKCTVFDENKLTELSMNGILSVGKGSLYQPRLIIMEYDGVGDEKKAPFAVIGKGVTFDSGGISLKPAGGMEKMKYDMSGAGAVLGIIKSAADLGLKKKVIGIIPAVENMPGGNAYKPGDVIKMASGLNVEVTNTDAEGRMILADALHYARETYKPEAMVDLATLTGACVVALGNKAVGLMGNNEGFIRKFLQYSQTSGEKAWQLPLWDEYDELMKSDIADIKNSGGGGAGTITGAVFLKSFVKNTPWIHLDIANTAWLESPEKGYLGKGPTGAGIRMLCEVLRKW